MLNRSSRRCVPLGLFLPLFLFLCSTSLAAQSKPSTGAAPAAQTAADDPLDLMEVGKLLQGGTASRRIVALVLQFGVNFPLTDEAKDRLRKLGADDPLLSVIADNRVFPAPKASPSATRQSSASLSPQGASAWTDPATGLMWTRESNDANITWKQAKEYCSELRLGGYSNWRLATHEELAGIYDETQNVGGCHVKGGIKFHDLCWSWSSSPGIDSGEAWGFGFLSGQESSVPWDESRYNTRALCVRRAGK